MTLAEISTAVGVTADAARAAIDELRSWRLVEERTPGLYAAAPAATAIETLVHRQLRQLEWARLELLRLDANGARRDLDFVTAPLEVAARIVADAASTGEAIDVALGRPNSAEAADVPAALLAAVAPASGRARLLLDDELVSNPLVSASVDDLLACGVRVRIARVALSHVRTGNAAVVVSLDPSEGADVLIARCPAVVALAREAFFATWRTGVVYGLPDATDADEITPMTAAVLQLLAAGVKDETIGRRLGLSRRSVQRHVQRAMDALGSTSRFQVGVEAVRRGIV